MKKTTTQLADGTQFMTERQVSGKVRVQLRYNQTRVVYDKIVDETEVQKHLDMAKSDAEAADVLGL